MFIINDRDIEKRMDSSLKKLKFEIIKIKFMLDLLKKLSIVKKNKKIAIFIALIVALIIFYTK